MFVINLNRQTLKTLFLLILVIKMNFFNKVGLYKFFLLYLWAKYEPIWTDFIAQTVTLRANLLIKAQTIHPTPSAHFFLPPKVGFTKDIEILNMAMVFEICFFVVAILKYVKIPKTVKNVPKKFNHNK